MSTGTFNLAVPERGTTDWHAPLNDNFGRIEQRVRSLADSLDVAVTIDLVQPTKGTTDWHVPLNDNFREIDDAIQMLGSAAGVGDVGGYSQPTKGTTDWHVPLNDNFGRIQTELRAITDAANADRLLEIIATTDEGTGIQYEFVVAAGGAVEKTTGRNTDVRAESNDSIDDRDDGTVVVTGTTGALKGDAFSVTGDIASFERTGGYDAAAVYLDGVDVTDELLGEDADPDAPETSGPTGDNFVFLTAGQLEAAAQRVEDGQQPFVAAHNRLINDADAALSKSLEAVTDDDGDHRFVADGNHGRHDYRAAIRMKDAARDCGLAYWFTGDDRYARKVVDIVRHWCLNDATYMRPTVNEVGNGISIEQNITIPGLVYAASFVRGHSHWSGQESDFEQWVADRMGTFRENEQTWHQYNNQWAWWIVDWGVSASYLGDEDAMERMKRLYRASDSWTTRITGESSNRPWTDYRVADSNKGYFNHERHRDRGFHYTGYNLRAMAQICVLAEAWDGTDLWSFNAPTDPGSGSTLRKAFNWFAPYVTDVWSWGWDANPPPNTETREEAACAYELAHARWDAFDAPIDRPDGIGGRPHHDNRLLGPVTLTHGAV